MMPDVNVVLQSLQKTAEFPAAEEKVK